MIPKPGKNPTDISSYRPTSLLPIISKVLEKLILKRINTDKNPHDWIPHHQFGFKETHSTVQQCHRITYTINKALEDQQYCTAVFLDVSQAFEKSMASRTSLKYNTLPPVYYNLLKSYLQDRSFLTKFNDETSPRFPTHSGVPQGSILGPLLYTIYTSDLPTSEKTTLSTFVDDTAHSDFTISSLNLQDHLHNIEKWLQKWKMEVNETKSTHTTFTLRKGQCPPVCINQTVIPQVETVNYLGLHFDRKLTWKEQIAMKRKQLDHKTRDIKWLIGKNSPLSLQNKTLIYKQYSSLYGPMASNCGLRQQIQCSNHATIPIKNSPNHCQRALLRNQSNTSH